MKCLNLGHKLTDCSQDFKCPIDASSTHCHNLLHDFFCGIKTVAMVNHKLSASSGYLGVQKIPEEN